MTDGGMNTVKHTDMLKQHLQQNSQHLTSRSIHCTA